MTTNQRIHGWIYGLWPTQYNMGEFGLRPLYIGKSIHHPTGRWRDHIRGQEWADHAEKGGFSILATVLKTSDSRTDDLSLHRMEIMFINMLNPMYNIVRPTMPTDAGSEESSNFMELVSTDRVRGERLAQLLLMLRRNPEILEVMFETPGFINAVVREYGNVDDIIAELPRLFQVEYWPDRWSAWADRSDLEAKTMDVRLTQLG